VKDEFPENKKMKSWTIPHHKVIRFPRDLRDPLMPGDRVLSLWYIPDTEEWSSMFYEATIVNTDDMEKVDPPLAFPVNDDRLIEPPFDSVQTSTIWLRFNGDDEVYEIDSMKIVKVRSRRPSSLTNCRNGLPRRLISSSSIQKPKRRSKVPKRPFTSAINGSSSPLHSPPTDGKPPLLHRKEGGHLIHFTFVMQSTTSLDHTSDSMPRHQNSHPTRNRE
jgi:hypothetical protein